jgi:hypothetical protein
MRNYEKSTVEVSIVARFPCDELEKVEEEAVTEDFYPLADAFRAKEEQK